MGTNTDCLWQQAKDFAHLAAAANFRSSDSRAMVQQLGWTLICFEKPGFDNGKIGWFQNYHLFCCDINLSPEMLDWNLKPGNWLVINMSFTGFVGHISSVKIFVSKYSPINILWLVNIPSSLTYPPRNKGLIRPCHGRPMFLCPS